MKFTIYARAISHYDPSQEALTVTGIVGNDLLDISARDVRQSLFDTICKLGQAVDPVPQGEVSYKLILVDDHGLVACDTSFTMDPAMGLGVAGVWWAVAEWVDHLLDDAANVQSHNQPVRLIDELKAEIQSMLDEVVNAN